MRNRKLKRAVILSLMIFGFHPVGDAAVNINGNDRDGNITIGAEDEYGTVDGYRQEADGKDINITKGNQVLVEGRASEVNGIWGWAEDASDVSVSGGTVTLDGGKVFRDDGSSTGGNINGNFAHSYHSNTSVQNGGNAEAINGSVYIHDGIVGDGKGTLYGINGSYAESSLESATADGGTVTISGASVVNFSSVPNNTYRGIVGSNAFVNENGTDLGNARATNGSVTISGGTVEGAGYVLGNLAYANGSKGGTAYTSGGLVTINEATGETEVGTSVRGSYARATTGDASALGSQVRVEAGTVNGEIYGGYGLVNTRGNVEVSGNTVDISGGTAATVIGGYGGRFGVKNQNDQSMVIEDNHVVLGGSSTVTGTVVGAYFRLSGFTPDETFERIVRNNTITITGQADLKQADLYGAYISGVDTVNVNAGNDLIVDGWKGREVNSLNNFNAIKFRNIHWENEGIVVEVLNQNAESSLAGMTIDLRESTTLAGGTSLKNNDYMYFIKSANGELGTEADKVLVDQNGDSDNIFTAGVAFEGTGKVEVEEDGSVKYTITSVKNTDQTDIVPVNSSLAAAFIVTGYDLVVDGLNAMEQDQLFGVKTFAIVEGHDSSYDVADDLKVNGWNGLYGVGNIREYKDGDLSYAAFFENGTANYRTFNSFMGESIRGDGSLVYNGGGIAGRYKKHNGFYTEASFRAGWLKNELKNMFRDGNGNIYGYKTEGPYYAFHMGAGKIIDLEDDRDLDLYVRYYHTYNDGDTFTVAGDRFEVDSITSDRIRIGTRYHVNNDKKFSTYYGLAWEYEFNGDADVRVNGQKLPVESLQGSSAFAEVGFVQRHESPWSWEGRVRGYVGEREGISGLLRVTYSF